LAEAKVRPPSERVRRQFLHHLAQAHGERRTSRIRARSSDQDCLYSVSVRQVATLLPRFFQTVPRGDRPCASLALCLTGPGQRTFTSKLSNMLGTPGAVDAQNAPTAPWKTRTERGFPTSVHSHSLFCFYEPERRSDPLRRCRSRFTRFQVSADTEGSRSGST
jgi:hypothetical protein